MSWTSVGRLRRRSRALQVPVDQRPHGQQQLAQRLARSGAADRAGSVPAGRGSPRAALELAARTVRSGARRRPSPPAACQPAGGGAADRLPRPPRRSAARPPPRPGPGAARAGSGGRRRRAVGAPRPSLGDPRHRSAPPARPSSNVAAAGRKRGHRGGQHDRPLLAVDADDQLEPDLLQGDRRPSGERQREPQPRAVVVDRRAPG